MCLSPWGAGRVFGEDTNTSLALGRIYIIPQMLYAGTAMPASSVADRPFHVIVKPIGAVCNLSCRYCYYLEKIDLYPDERSFRMPDEILEELTRQYIESQPEAVQELHFSWQGGEPTLLGVEFFRKAIALQKKHERPGLRILNTMQTNGTLLDDKWGRFLSDEGFLVGISIDGPEPVHDRFRRDASGSGSLDSVLRGLEVLKKHSVEFNTLTVVNRVNGDQPEATYDFLKQIGSRFFQFIPIVERDRESRMTAESVGSRQWGRFLTGIFDLWKQADVGEIFVQYFDVFLGLYMGLPSSLCVFAETCGSAAALEHNGDLYSCDHFVFPDYLLGNLSEQSLTGMLDGEFQSRFGQDKQDGLPLVCRRCSYLSLCNGACPAHRFLKSPGGEANLNYLCEGFKFFFQQALPTFRAMAACLNSGRPARDYPMHLGSQAGRQKTGRNQPCPCGSGEKHKNCCGRMSGR